jgi:hypothetical protein
MRKLLNKMQLLFTKYYSVLGTEQKRYDAMPGAKENQKRSKVCSFSPSAK